MKLPFVPIICALAMLSVARADVEYFLEPPSGSLAVPGMNIRFVVKQLPDTDNKEMRANVYSEDTRQYVTTARRWFPGSIPDSERNDFEFTWTVPVNMARGNYFIKIDVNNDQDDNDSTRSYTFSVGQGRRNVQRVGGGRGNSRYGGAGYYGGQQGQGGSNYYGGQGGYNRGSGSGNGYSGGGGYTGEDGQYYGGGGSNNGGYGSGGRYGGGGSRNGGSGSRLPGVGVGRTAEVEYRPSSNGDGSNGGSSGHSVSSSDHTSDSDNERDDRMASSSSSNSDTDSDSSSSSSNNNNNSGKKKSGGGLFGGLLG